jgi:hypothetical protein
MSAQQFILETNFNWRILIIIEISRLITKPITFVFSFDELTLFNKGTIEGVKF